MLSPSTQSIDLAAKLADYFQVASIQHYLIAGAHRREVIRHCRAGAEIVTQVVNIGSMRLNPPGIEIDLAEIYPAAL